MKKLLLVVILITINLLISYAQWVPCNNGIIDYTIRSFIVDGINTYAGTSSGIYMTTDNGESWIAKSKGLKYLWGDCLIQSLTISGNNIFAGTMGSGIFMSSDKGESWELKSNGLPKRLFGGRDTIFSEDISSIIISGNNIFAGTNGAVEDTVKGFYISTDNGNSWMPKNNGLPKYKETIQDVHSLAISGNNIFAGTSYGVFMTSDNGENWSPKNKGIENWWVGSLAIKGNNIFAGTVYGGIFLSTDNGESWKYIGMKDTIIAAIIVKGNYILAGGGFYISSNNGDYWTKYLDEIGVLSIIINGDYVFAGTASHGILRAKLSDLGITDVKEQEQTNENRIYPNPASNEFRLRFHAPIETIVQINIFDYLGNKVLSRTEQATEGTNEKNINCEKLPQGYYYVKININEVVETVPLVILK